MPRWTLESSHITLRRDAGLRSTRQRLAIVDEVFHCHHPTVFDVKVEPHANLVCTGCGPIEDSSASDDLLPEIRYRVESGGGFRPESQRLDIYGPCSNCATAVN